jgi:hypothetical protein
MKRAALSCLALAIIAGSAYSQVNICGRVTDPSGTPLTNTLVRLGQTRADNGYGMAPYYTTTDATGYFHLGTGTCAVNVINAITTTRDDAFSRPDYRGGRVLFSLPQDNVQVRMSVYDLAGRFVRDVMNSRLSRGNYAVSIDTRGISSQFYLLHVSINGAASVIKLQPFSRVSAGAVAQNAPVFQARLEKLTAVAVTAVVDTLHATEPGYMLGVSPISALTGTCNFTLAKNNTWNGDTAGFWDTANVKKQAGHFWYTIINRTNGRWPDSMIYWAIGDGGVPVCLRDSAHVDFTTSASGRLYIMVGYKPGSPYRPANQCWDFEEHTNGLMGDGLLWFHGNTTRVDGYGLPIAYRLHCTDGYDMVRGEKYHVYFQSRASFFAEYVNEVPYEFTVLGTMRAPYKIPNAGTNGSDVGPGGKYATYSDKYCTAFGIGQTPYLNGIPLPKNSAACHRHVLGLTDAQMLIDTNFYKAAPCNFYSYFLHRRATANKCYGFPYDDYANGSSYLEHGNVSWLEIAVGY